MTEAGSCTPELAACSWTLEPPAGAAEASCTVQRSVPTALGSGLQVRLVTVPGVFVNEMVPVCELPFNVAVMMAVWFDVKLPAVALKVAEMAPAATVTDAGTVTTAVLLLRPTAAPPFGAAWVKVTVQVVVLPEPSVPGVHVTEITPAPARTERDDLLMPFKVALTFAVWPAAVADAVAENVPLVVPAAMVTCA